jgi:aspartate/methionine/tyrosine aminotransferase
MTRLASRMTALPGPGTTAAAEAARQARAGGRPVLDLRSFGTASGVPPDHVREAVARAAREPRAGSSDGLPELREAIAAKLAKDNGITADPRGEILVTTGAKEGLYLAMGAIVEPGDEVLYHVPNYVFDGAIRLHGGVPVHLPTSPGDGFALHLDDAAPAVTARTKVFVLCNPVNPTGHVPTRQEVDAIGAFVQRHDLWLLVDESYEKYVYDGAQRHSPAAHPDLRARTITVQSFSKGYALFAYRLGYVAAPAPVIAACRRLLEWIDIYLGAVPQHAALAALSGPSGWIDEMLAAWQQARDRLVTEMRRRVPDMPFVTPQGTGFVFPDVAAFGRPSSDVAAMLLDGYGIPCVPGSVFQGEGRVRLGFGGTAPVQQELFDALARALDDHRAGRGTWPLSRQ